MRQTHSPSSCCTSKLMLSGREKRHQVPEVRLRVRVEIPSLIEGVGEVGQETAGFNQVRMVTRP